MTKNAKELWDRSKISTISMTSEAEQAFFSRAFTHPCNELHRPCLSLALGSAIKYEEPGETSQCREAGAWHYIW